MYPAVIVGDAAPCDVLVLVVIDENEVGRWLLLAHDY
jgi:hypothetical protein